MTITTNPTLINGKKYSELSREEQLEVMHIIEELTASILANPLEIKG